MRLSKIANISITETDNMDVLEEKELINLLIKDLAHEEGTADIGDIDNASEYAKRNNADGK